MTVLIDDSWLALTEIKDFQEKHWIKIFHHNVKKADYFKKREDALFSLKPFMFSLINKIGDSIRIDGKYEFLLEYPEMTGFNMWRQTNHPLREDESKSQGRTEAEGFDSMNLCTWTKNGFRGLVLSSVNVTLLDGSSYQGYYYYSIGATEQWIYGSIPADGEEHNITEVLLWSRVNAIKLKKTFTKRSMNVMVVAFLSTVI